jgi:hypothetical protein
VAPAVLRGVCLHPEREVVQHWWAVSAVPVDHFGCDVGQFVEALQDDQRRRDPRHLQQVRGVALTALP